MVVSEKLKIREWVAAQPWLDGALLWTGVIAFIAVLANRSGLANHVWWYLVPVLAAAMSAWRLGLRAENRWILVCMLGWVGWTAWCDARTPLRDVAFGRWGLDVATFAVFWLSVAMPHSFAVRCRVLGIATVVTIIQRFVMQWVSGDSGILWGHANYLGSLLAPMLLVSVTGVWLSARKSWQWALVWTLVASCALIGYSQWAIPGIPRRGILLSATAGAFVTLWVLFFQRSPRWAISSALVLAIAGSFLVAFIMRDSWYSLRSDRLLMYRAAIGQIQHFFPWGGGAFGALRLDECLESAVRTRTASGIHTLNVHNEWLESLLNYGVLGGLLFMSGLLALCWRCWQQRGSSAAISLGGIAAVGVHAMLDNTYMMQGPLMITAAFLGMLVRPLGHDESPVASVSASVGVRMTWIASASLGWAAALISLWCLWNEAPNAYVKWNRSPEERVAVLMSTRNPDVVRMEMEHLIGVAIANAPFLPQMDTIIHLSENKARASIFHGGSYLQLYEARRVLVDGAITQQFQVPIRGISDLQSRMLTLVELVGIRMQQDRREVVLLQQMLHRYLFHRPMHLRTGFLIQGRLDLVRLLSSVERQRVARYIGVAPLSIASLDRNVSEYELASNIESAADFVAGSWPFLESNRAEEIPSWAVRTIVDSYWSIDGVAAWAVNCMCSNPTMELADVSGICAKITFGWSMLSIDERLIAVLQTIRDSGKAEHAWMVLSYLYPHATAVLNRNLGEAPMDAGQEEFLELRRIYELTLGR